MMPTMMSTANIPKTMPTITSELGPPSTTAGLNYVVKQT